MKAGGTAMQYSSVPCQRCHWIAPPDPKSVADQMPIIPAPIATKSSDPGRAPALNIRYAIDAKMTGEMTETMMKKPERVRLFRWKAQPM
jgi:hypothetical protein